MLDTRTSTKLACCIALVFGATTLAAQQSSTSSGRERGDLDQIRKVSTLIGTEVMNTSISRSRSFGTSHSLPTTPCYT